MRIFFKLLLLFCCIGVINGQEAILIQNVNVWDGTSDDLAVGQQVLIEGNLIKTVAKEILVSQDVKRIDGQGKTLKKGKTA